MTFETKYKLQDEFWVMQDNKPERFNVQEIIVHCSLEPGDHYGHSEKQTVEYISYAGKARVTADKFFPTKEALLASL